MDSQAILLQPNPLILEGPDQGHGDISFSHAILFIVATILIIRIANKISDRFF